jgi:hypothetical protein
VLDLCAERRRPDFDWIPDGEDDFGDLSTRYAGPAHLASLLLTTTGGIADAVLSRLPAPAGADGAFWPDWLRCRAETMPFASANHREAIAAGFYNPAGLRCLYCRAALGNYGQRTQDRRHPRADAEGRVPRSYSRAG